MNKTATMGNKQLSKFISQSSQAIFERLKHRDYQELLLDKFLLYEIVQMGIPVYLFKEIKEICVLDDLQWADQLDIKNVKLVKTEKNEEHIFNSEQSEKILFFLEVNIYGLLVFESKDKLKSWLNTDFKRYQNHKPVELIKSSYGKALVMEELSNIEYGLFL